MNKIIRWIAILVLVAVGIVLGLSSLPQAPEQVQATFEGLPPSTGTYSRVTGPVRLQFPRDMGPHPDTQTEWWYYTGNLKTPAGNEFGYQLTFFRKALLAADQAPSRSSAWAVSQVYLAHFALSDASGQEFHQAERIERGAAGLAGAFGSPTFQVWLQDWSVVQTGDRTYQLSARQDGVSIALILEDLKGPVLQGESGYSQKGSEPGNASTYVSLTRLKTRGEVTIDGVKSEVSGLSWMDHEFGTSALGKGQTGWDWFSIQLNDENELMVYNIRNRDGSASSFSRGMLILKDGTTRSLRPEEFNIQINSYWKSINSGAQYPSSWVVTVPSENLVLDVQPILADQELRNSFVYWEGAVRVKGTRQGLAITGAGYVELTGYARSFEGGF